LVDGVTALHDTFLHFGEVVRKYEKGKWKELQASVNIDVDQARRRDTRDHRQDIETTLVFMQYF
jgi:hypothetical protein